MWTHEPPHHTTAWTNFSHSKAVKEGHSRKKGGLGNGMDGDPNQILLRVPFAMMALVLWWQADRQAGTWTHKTGAHLLNARVISHNRNRSVLNGVKWRWVVFEYGNERGGEKQRRVRCQSGGNDDFPSFPRVHWWVASSSSIHHALSCLMFAHWTCIISTNKLISYLSTLVCVCVNCVSPVPSPPSCPFLWYIQIFLMPVCSRPDESHQLWHLHFMFFTCMVKLQTITTSAVCWSTYRTYFIILSVWCCVLSVLCEIDKTAWKM